MNNVKLNPNTIVKTILSLVFFLLANFPCFAQAGVQADISITSVIISSDMTKREGSPADAKITFGNLKCTITVHNENGGYSNQTMLVVMLPREITIVSDLNNSTVYRSGNGNRGGWAGSLLINLHNIGVGQDRIIEFTFTRSAYENKIAAYVFSGCPDPRPANNFNETTY